jgi:hypothetical protein
MIETVVALLMFWDGEIKEHRIQESMADCLRARRVAERDFNPNISYKCIRSEAETEIYIPRLEKTTLQSVVDGYFGDGKES